MYRFHKVHHEFQHTNAAAAFHGTLADALLNTWPVGVLLPYLMGFHGWTLAMWVWLHNAHSHYEHAGYDLPFDPCQLIPFANHPAEHAFHHSHNSGNFGLYWTFWDHWAGTNHPFRSHLPHLCKSH
jgi:sterol desaturase/sphingolipid hydroxylase (fatty acid hydroxylase superfamily)